MRMSKEHVEQDGRDDVFNRPLYLAGVLDNAADELRQTWLGYEWNDRTRCNCGIVAQQVMQTSAVELKRLLPPIYDNGVFRPTWTAMTQAYCSDSGLTQNEVFSRLLAAGFRATDFAHLENLSHARILARMEPYRNTMLAMCRSRKSDVVAYLRAWAIGIEEFHDTPLPRRAEPIAVAGR
jgi:hypothetical protein